MSDITVDETQKLVNHLRRIWPEIRTSETNEALVRILENQLLIMKQLDRMVIEAR